MNEQDATPEELYERYGRPVCYECGSWHHDHMHCPGVVLQLTARPAHYEWDGLDSISDRRVK